MRTALLTIGALLIGVTIGLAEKSETFYITFPYEVPHNTTIRINASSRIHALANIGATVWTAKEWSDCQPCKFNRVVTRADLR